MHSFKFASQFFSLMTMTQLYYTHIYPHLISNISIWGSSNPQKTYLQPLIKTQKHIIRLIRRVPPCSHTKPIMAQLKILNITNLYILRVCTEMHPFIYPPPNKEPLNRPEHNHNFTPASEIHNHNTRYTTVNRQHLTDNMEHFTRAHAIIWNSLPPKLSNTRTRNTFKTELKVHLLRKQNEP